MTDVSEMKMQYAFFENFSYDSKERNTFIEKRVAFLQLSFQVYSIFVTEHKEFILQNHTIPQFYWPCPQWIQL